LTVAVAAVLAGAAAVLAIAGLTQPTAWAAAVPLGAVSYVLWNRGRERMIEELYDFDFDFGVEVEAGRRREATEDWHRDWPPDDDVGTDAGTVEEPWEDWEWAREAARGSGSDSDPDSDSDSGQGSDGDRAGPVGGVGRRRRDDPGDWYPGGSGRKHGGSGRDRSPSAPRGAGGSGVRTVDPGLAEACRVLGVDPDADETTIREAYRERVKETHPDAGGSREAFERVQRAYERLIDGRE